MDFASAFITLAASTRVVKAAIRNVSRPPDTEVERGRLTSATPT